MSPRDDKNGSEVGSALAGKLRDLPGLRTTAKRMLAFLRAIIRPRLLPVQTVTSGRIGMERNGQLAYLEYSVSGNVLELIHTEVPKNLRGTGLASSLAKAALDWARRDNYRVDIICPYVAGLREGTPGVFGPCHALMPVARARVDDRTFGKFSGHAARNFSAVKNT